MVMIALSSYIILIKKMVKSIKPLLSHLFSTIAAAIIFAAY